MKIRFAKAGNKKRYQGYILPMKREKMIKCKKQIIFMI